MKPALIFIFGCAAILLVLFSRTARLEAKPESSHASQRQTRTEWLSVIDYFYLLPSVGIGGATRQEKRELLQAENHPVIDVRHDYMLVHPDSSPAEQIAVFRSPNKADLIADSSPDFESDYNDFTLFRLQGGRLRNVTRQMLPMPSDTEHLLYELPRVGSTIRVFRFNLDTETHRHVFDLEWREGHFVRIR